MFALPLPCLTPARVLDFETAVERQQIETVKMWMFRRAEAERELTERLQEIVDGMVV